MPYYVVKENKRWIIVKAIKIDFTENITIWKKEFLV